jgi:hypothetical protein
VDGLLGKAEARPHRARWEINLRRRSYLLGAAIRISERLDAITEARTQTSPSGKALTLANRTDAARRALEEKMPVGTMRARKRTVSEGDFIAGMICGEAASFARPVGGGTQAVAPTGDGRK